MAEDKAKSKPKKKPPSSAGSAPPGMGPPEPDMDEADPMMGGAPGGMPPAMGGAPGGMPPPMGPRPPMPGQGVDPYAALAGMNGMGPSGGPPPGAVGMGQPLPMDMPMGMGPGGQIAPGGPMGMGGDLSGGMPGGMGGQGDELTAALMGELNPAAGHPTNPEHVFDPQQMDQQGMSVQQLLQMLMLAQGGIPNSGVNPTPPPRNVGSSIFPGDQFGGM